MFHALILCYVVISLAISCIVDIRKPVSAITYAGSKKMGKGGCSATKVTDDVYNFCTPVSKAPRQQIRLPEHLVKKVSAK